MRTRIKDTRVGPRYPLVAAFTNAGHGGASCNPYPTAYVGTRSVMQDTNNSSTFRTGAIVMSACELLRIERQAEENPVREAEAANINGSLAKVKFSGDFAGYFAYGLPNRLSVDMGNAPSIALVEAYAKMNTSATLGGEQLATMKQTIGMIRSPFKSLTKLAIQARKRLAKRKQTLYRTYKRDRAYLRKTRAKPIRYSELARAFLLDIEKAVADCWLELRYGMQPLLIDAETHIDVIKQKMHEQESHNQRRVARSGKLSKSTSDSYDGPVWCGLDYVYEPRAAASWSLERRVTAGVIFSVSPRSNIDELNSHLGLRLRDLPATAWELIPLSFVVDWALNVGDWLQAITPSPGIQPLANWVTTIDKRSTTITGVCFKTYLGWFTNHEVTFTFPPGTETHFSYARDVDNSLATSPMFLGKPLSNARVGDAAAMTVAKFVTSIKRILD